MNTDLMIKRFKVIADYPDPVFRVGQIIQQEEIEQGQYLYNMDFFPKFPHLFRELQWYEEREVSEMPEYVKYYYEYKLLGIEHIIKWDMKRGIGILPNKGVLPQVISLNHSVFPATEQEYNDYINKSK